MPAIAKGAVVSVDLNHGPGDPLWCIGHVAQVLEDGAFAVSVLTPKQAFVTLHLNAQDENDTWKWPAMRPGPA